MENLRSELNDCKVSETKLFSKPGFKEPNSSTGEYFIAIDIHLFQIKNKQLEGKLASTEETVRCQTEKMKCYRGMLENAGLLPKGATPRRSHSESNLSTIASEDSISPNRRIATAGSNESISVSSSFQFK